MENDYRKAANITIIVAGIMLFSWFFFKYALGAFIPFLLAAAIAAIIAPISDKLSKKLKTPKKLTSAVLVILFFAALVALAYLAGYRLIAEASNLIDRLSADPEIISKTIEAITERLGKIGSRFGFLSQLSESEAIQKLGLDLDRLLSNALNSLMSSLTGALPSAAAGILAKVPEFFLFLAVLVISSFYFCTDQDALAVALSSVLPDKWSAKLPLVKENISSTLRGYIKAYLLIMLLTFCEVFLGLSILGVNYAFILSIIIAIVDILPILGTGTVLLPWALFSLITSDYKMGIGLLVLYAAVSVIRQVAEPKIVGNTLGLHPLATLASIYISVRFIGFWGIFIGPIIALLICNFFKGDGGAPTDTETNNDIENTDKKLREQQKTPPKNQGNAH